MSGLTWRPLSRRADGEAGRVLLEGVPDHLDVVLRRWVSTTLETRAAVGLAQRVALRLHLDPRDLRAAAEPALPLAEVLAWGTDHDQLLDVVDAVLFAHPSHELLRQAQRGVELAPAQSLLAVAHASARTAAATPLQLAAGTLGSLLADADSVWTVAEDARGLRRRIDGAVSAAAARALSAAAAAGCGAAATDLEAAGARLYGLHPDPSEAYRLAVRAVEHAVVPVLSPAHTKATLGSVLSQLRDTTTRWVLPTGHDATVVQAMIKVLWEGHGDRHGGQPDPQPVDPAAAEVALGLATTLVQWFTAGHVQPVAGQLRATSRPSRS